MQKVRRELAYNGLAGLSKSGSQFIQKQIRGLPYYYLRKRTLEFQELKQYCNSSGNYWQYGDGCSVDITADVEGRSLPEQFHEMVNTYQIDPSYVFELPDAKLLGEHATAVTATDQIVLESTRGKHTKLHNAIAEPSFPRRTATIGPSKSSKQSTQEYDCVFPLVLPKATFFVWIVEYLPKLHGWAHYARETGHQPTIVLWQGAPSWMRESVELLGVDDIIEDQFEVLHADRLVLGTHNYHNIGIDYNPYCRSEYRWLSERMRTAVETSGTAKKIYISRADAARRRIENESDLYGVLDSYGFEQVTLADKPFAEQVRTLAGADVVLALHGAGLAHLLWAEDPTVIELVPETYTRPTFFCFSQVLGLEYSSIIVETTDNSVPPRERDVRVDVKEVENVLEQVEV